MMKKIKLIFLIIVLFSIESYGQSFLSILDLASEKHNAIHLGVGIGSPINNDIDDSQNKLKPSFSLGFDIHKDLDKWGIINQININYLDATKSFSSNQTESHQCFQLGIAKYIKYGNLPASSYVFAGANLGFNIFYRTTNQHLFGLKNFAPNDMYVLNGINCSFILGYQINKYFSFSYEQLINKYLPYYTYPNTDQLSKIYLSRLMFHFSYPLHNN